MQHLDIRRIINIEKKKYLELSATSFQLPEKVRMFQNFHLKTKYMRNKTNIPTSR